MSDTGFPEVKLRRGVIVTMSGYLLAQMLGLPKDVTIRAIYADTRSDSIKVVLQSDIRFKPVPENQEMPQIYPQIQLRLMPPVTDPDPDQHAPGPDDVMFVRYVLSENDLPPVDQGDSTT